MEKPNYQKQLDSIIAQLDGRVPRVLLHSCCAPCSSYCMEYLSQFFELRVLYYNPNISPESEYRKRVEELRRLVSEMTFAHPVEVVEGDYRPQDFYAAVRGLEHEPEGGARCWVCYEQRLREAAAYAKKMDCDFFTTTLTISPLKRAEKINEIGQRVAEEMGVAFLPSDFKKRNGYKRSIELSSLHHLYRQNYCGCVFSRREEKQPQN